MIYDALASLSDLADCENSIWLLGLFSHQYHSIVSFCSVKPKIRSYLETLSYLRLLQIHDCFYELVYKYPVFGENSKIWKNLLRIQLTLVISFILNQSFGKIILLNNEFLAKSNCSRIIKIITLEIIALRILTGKMYSRLKCQIFRCNKLLFVASCKLWS